jgi:HlyD family secretion protein
MCKQHRARDSRYLFYPNKKPMPDTEKDQASAASMDEGSPTKPTEIAENAETRRRQNPEGAQPAAARRVSPAPALIVTFILCAIIGMSLWYLGQPQPLIIQGEADATRIDIAARVDGRVGKRPVERGDNVAAGQLLYDIDNPELVTQLREAQAGVTVASAQLANIEVGTRAEVIAQRKSSVESATANLTLSQKTYDRIKELAGSGNAPIQQLDEATNSLQVAQRGLEQAKLAYEEAVNGATKEERRIAMTSVLKAQASVDSIKAQVDELVVRAPVAAQVYQIGAELGEYVSPGVPLLSLVDLGDVWLRFDLREDLVKGLKVGDQIRMRVPALGDRQITAAVRVIATKGEYAGWRATRATGDFDLRTFEVRAYPISPIPSLRPGMSVYAEWPGGQR